ncbi:RNA recognition motif domain-containing protein [Vibrio palustris]|uniref:RNA recognition motif. (A.k.a. RRM, RBD, or RNP domain) n=1 Tax=Vibrio palustris TaxID=1918946 RepID=A0A1R4B4X2_9VIBR|nr:RNA-binding protein [Vibrio palustris]SJL83953.1 RNA recognition motif. (a.k.a. RRM, RBD, or RNP domain) [Vibrio palustris]
MKLLVRNLARTLSEHDLRVLFSEYGNVTHCNLVLDANSGHSKGFGFVEMPDKDEATKAMNALNMALIKSNKIRVKAAQE